MKLQLKHIMPYLLYDVKCLYDGGHIDGISFDYLSDFGCEYFKPILRPLSDLLKVFARDKDYLCHLESKNDYQPVGEFLDHLRDFQYKLNEASWDCCPIVVYTFLLQNHFDVFNLIPEGLAIDINKL